LPPLPPHRRLLKAEEFSVGNPSLTAGRPALPALINSVLRAASSSVPREQHQRDSSLADRAPSIQHGPALPVPADQVLREDAPALAHGQDLARHGQASREHAQEVALLPLEKHRGRNAPRTIEVVAAGSSIRRRRKAQ